MTIPIGRTSRQLGTIARWMLAVLVVAAMLAWWTPSLHRWGALSMGMLATLLLFVTWRIVAGARKVRQVDAPSA